MIRFSEVSKIFPGRPNRLALQGFNYSFAARGLYLLVGPNGSGKSTLLKMIAGRIHPSQGKIEIDEADRPAVYIDFKDCFLGDLTLEENLIEAYRNSSSGPLDEEAISEQLIKFDLLAARGTKASKLSYGEKQRLAVLIAMARDSAVLLVDEPDSNLDRESSLKVIELLEQISHQKLVIVATNRPEIYRSFNSVIVDLAKRYERSSESSIDLKVDENSGCREKKTVSRRLSSFIRVFIRHHIFRLGIRAALLPLLVVGVISGLGLNYECDLQTARDGFGFLNSEQALVYRNDLKLFEPSDQELLAGPAVDRFSRAYVQRARLSGFENSFEIILSDDGYNHLPRSLAGASQNIILETKYNSLGIGDLLFDLLESDVIYLDEETFDRYSFLDLLDHFEVKTEEESYKIVIRSYAETDRVDRAMKLSYFGLEVGTLTSLDSVAIAGQVMTVIPTSPLIDIFASIYDDLFKVLTFQNSVIARRWLTHHRGDSRYIFFSPMFGEQALKSEQMFYCYLFSSLALLLAVDLGIFLVQSKLKGFVRQMRYLGFRHRDIDRVLIAENLIGYLLEVILGILWLGLFLGLTDWLSALGGMLAVIMVFSTATAAWLLRGIRGVIHDRNR